jgi:hypothetical protein
MRKVEGGTIDRAITPLNRAITATPEVSRHKRKTRMYREVLEQAMREFGDVRLSEIQSEISARKPIALRKIPIQAAESLLEKDKTVIRKYPSLNAERTQESNVTVVERNVHRVSNSIIRFFPSVSGPDPEVARKTRTRGLSSTQYLSIERRLAAISKSVNAIRNTLFRLVSLFRYWHVIHSTNALAFQAYGLHVALRIRIGRMIFTRQRSHKKHTIRRLESRLLALRAYDGVLFYNKPDWTSEYVKQKLQDLEMRSLTQRALVVNTQVGVEQRARRLSAVNEQAHRWAKRKQSLPAAIRSVGQETVVDTARSPIRRIRNSPRMARNADVKSTHRRFRRVKVQHNRIRKHVVATRTRRMGGRAEFRKTDFDKLVSRRVVARRSRRDGRRTAERASRKEQLAATVSSWLGSADTSTKLGDDGNRARLFGSQLQGSDGRVSGE